MIKKGAISFALIATLIFSWNITETNQKAEAADWVKRGSIWTTYYHSGYFSNYVYQRTFKPTHNDVILAGVSAKSSASGSFKVILQKRTSKGWVNYRTKYATKNGYTSLNFYDVTKKATYRIKFENIGSKRVNYTFNVQQ